MVLSKERSVVWLWAALFFLASFLTCTRAQDVFVSNDFTDATCTIATRNCPDVASALNITSSFDSIMIYPGVYSGKDNTNICIKSSCAGLTGIKLQGLGPAEEIVFSDAGTTFADTVAIIINDNTIVSIVNVTFSGFANRLSTEPNKAGAIEIGSSSVYIGNVIFQNNSGVVGGAMHVLNSNVTLNGTHFLGNSAKLHGGALMLVNSNLNIDSCLFFRNNVSTQPADLAGTGGAIYFLGVNDLSISNSEFTQNVGERAGGAIFMDLNSNTAIKTFKGKFSALNTAFRGNQINGLGSCISAGTCNSKGGALFLNVLSTALTGCVFEGNTVTTTSTTVAAQGGGMYVTTNALDILSPFVGTYVQNCTFRDNHATGQGGALYVDGQRLELFNSLFTANYVDTVNSYFTDSPSQGGAIYFSSGSLGAVTSNIIDCIFAQNSAYSGWGGAIFGTDSVGPMYLQRSVFSNNVAYSSYTNTGHGGALMVASAFTMDLYDCQFYNNSAIPYLQLVPLTYSGAGGAIFAQTAAVNITKSIFNHNLALTGQFDSGSAGGAIMLEDCFPATVAHCTFNANGASGYYGYSSFASPGTGGAIYVKFSAAKLYRNDYTNNWVTAGGNEASIGGAVAVFFEYSSVSKSSAGVTIGHSQFTGNVAYGELCTVPNQAGQGGALAVVGAAMPAVTVSHVNFTQNMALTASKKSSSYAKSESLSLGGALSIALSSNITIYKSLFANNIAYNGAGNDISSISGQSEQENFVHSTDSTFVAGTKAGQTLLVEEAGEQTVEICSTIKAYVELAKNMVISNQATKYVYQRTMNSVAGSAVFDVAGGFESDTIHSSHENAVSSLQASAVSLFPVPTEWHQLLTATDSAASPFAAAAFPTTSTNTGLFDKHAAAVKTARWQYLQHRDSSLLTLPGARRRVHYIVNQLLRLDLWLQQQNGGGHQHAQEQTQERQQEGPRIHTDVNRHDPEDFPYTLLGRRSKSSATIAFTTAPSSSNDVKTVSESSTVNTLLRLQEAYRANLYAELDAEYARLILQQKWATQEHARETRGERISEYKFPHLPSADATTVSPDNPASALLNFHPYVVITSGRAYFENPTFQGVYHMFFGDFPQIAQYTYNDNYITNSIVTVPSYSAIFGHITQEDLTLTAITASIEIFDSNDQQEYGVHQINLFNATLQLNRNVTVTGSSFVTGSLITSVSENTSSLIPYVAGGDNHPYVTFEETLFTGVSLKSVLSAFSSAFDTKDDNSLNTTEQTLVTINSCTLLIEGALVSDSPTENHGSFDLVDFPTKFSTNARILLTSQANIHIAPQGAMILLAETYIEAASTSAPAIYNQGHVELVGRTKVANYSHTGRLEVSPFSHAASLGSLASRLVVHGSFVQTTEGSTTIFLNRTNQNSPAMYLISSANYSGSVYVNFYSSAESDIFPDLLLYDVSEPSEWMVIAFRDRYSDNSLLSFDELTVHPQSPGLVFAQSTEEVLIIPPGRSLTATSANASNMFAWGLQITNIGCPQINDYYYGVPQQDQIQSSSPNSYACYVCLQNTSCNLCNGANGAAAGVCAVAGTCGSLGVAFGDSCCSGGCNGEYGTCKVSADHTSFSCDCSKTIWYTGANCKELSPDAYVVIFSCVSFLITIIVMGFFYHRSLQQKRIVLDELADGLLNHQTEGVNSEYIQYMQQALILNDVFVKWEEITLESVVGEGSFGVVHKATFRGAQVAVKQMRSMFQELTDKEIDEFRKEAYVMSRLRHPNIVLVMGISLVDQEPIALPKSRSNNMSIDAFEGAGPEVKKSKPQKTVCIITEFLEQGSLADILYGPTKLPAEIWTYELVLTCALQAARGMLYLHSHQPPICHRDLKSSNLVVDDHWVVKVTDFGMSRIVPENVQNLDKGIVTSVNSTSTQSSSHPLGPRKFSLNASPAGRKFSLGWPSQASSSLQSNATGTIAVSPTPAATAATLRLKAASDDIRESGVDPEIEPGERHSIATVDSMQDSFPSQDTSSLHAKAGAGRNPNSRLSTFNPEMTSNLGTTAWCAPEVLVSGSKTRYTVKVDVYSFGLVLWELWEKKRPFEELTSRFDIMDAVRSGKRPEISANCPPSYRSLIQRCWQHEPSRRPMFKYIVRYLKDELARVKRQKGGALYNPDTRQSGNYRESDVANNASGRSRLTAFNIGGTEMDVEPRKSGSNFSGAAGGIAEMADAAAEFFRKSFSFNTRSSFNHPQPGTSPASNHRPWMAGGGTRDTESTRDSDTNPAIVALQAAVRSRPSDGTRTSEGTSLSSTRVSGGARSDATGTGSTGTGPSTGASTMRASEASGNAGMRPSENVPVKYPEGRSPLVSAVTSERSLSYLTESPSPFSQMAALTRQQNRVGGAAAGPAPSAPVTTPAPTPATKNINNRWRDRYVLQFSGWQSSNPDAGLPPSMTSPSGSNPATPLPGLPPTRPSQSAPQAMPGQPAFSSPPIAAAPDTNYNPLRSGTALSRTNSNTSSAASSPKPGMDRTLASGAGVQEDIFVLDDDEEQKL